MSKPYEVIIAGVGGQGAVTVAQLVLGAAWRAGFNALQSEVHGMSQRGGSVNAHVIFDKGPVTTPIAMEGSAQLLIGMEPLESLRYLNLLSQDANMVVSNKPIINMDGYPQEDKLFAALEQIPGVELIDTDRHAKELNNSRAGNIVLLGLASNYMPIDLDVWKGVIRERFAGKGDVVVEKNIVAFEHGRALKKN